MESENSNGPDSPESSSSHYSSAQEGPPSSDEDEAEGGVAIDDYTLFSEEPASPVSSGAMRQPLSEWGLECVCVCGTALYI